MSFWRLKIGWFTLASRRHLQLIALFFYVQCRQEPPKIFQKIKLAPPQQQPRQSCRSPPAVFEYGSPRTRAWDASFTILGKRLCKRLSITEFDFTRYQELKAWVYNLFLAAEFRSWLKKINVEGLLQNLAANDPTLPLFEAAFTTPGHMQYLSTPGFSLKLPFTDPTIPTPFKLTSRL